VSAHADRITDAAGLTCTDLHNGYGAVFLGHGYAPVVAALQAQAEQLWIPATDDAEAGAQARAAFERFTGPRYRCAGLYSTGMEAAEFALRLSRGITRRGHWVGFGRSMHGKSLATAGLAWPQPYAAPNQDWCSLPFLSEAGEDETLARLEAQLRARPTAAVWVEPVMGSHGGLSASAPFYREVERLARAHGALLIVDEILTGCHRTGPRFVFEDLALSPDAVLVGKACGNGFPVAALMVRDGVRVLPDMLPGSTFSENALACAVVQAALGGLAEPDLPRRVAAIDARLRQGLQALEAAGPWEVRGAGALWFISLPPGSDVAGLRARLRAAGVRVSGVGRHLRLLPAACIDLGRLDEACAAIRRELGAQAGG
jgi:acetylornithine/succinyldiaminopimelate/putrescine aminotransferase